MIIDIILIVAIILLIAEVWRLRSAVDTLYRRCNGLTETVQDLWAESHPALTAYRRTLP